MNCPNCKANVGCSCQLRRASDGAQVCNSCFLKYEAALNEKRNPVKNEIVEESKTVVTPSGEVKSTDPVINSVTYNQHFD